MMGEAGVSMTLVAGLVLRTTLLLGLLLVAAAALRRASAGTRHLMWSAGIVSVLILLPVVTFSPLRWEVLPASLSGRGLEAPSSAALGEVGAGAAVAGLALEGSGPGSVSDIAGPPTAASAAGPAGSARFGARPSRALLVWLWAVPALLLILRLLWGTLRLRQLTADARPLTGEWTALLYESADRLELSSAPLLLSSDRVTIPFTCGVLRPIIVVPQDADDWSEARRRAVLCHELAHIRRHDLLGHLLGRVACALHWFNPLIWLAARRLRAESERASDDLVLAAGATASEYADHLLQIVSGARRSGAPAVALPMAQRSEFEGRMLAILEGGMRRSAPRRGPAVLLAAGVGVTALLVATAAPASTAAPPAPLASTESPAPLASADAHDAGAGLLTAADQRPSGTFGQDVAGRREDGRAEAMTQAAGAGGGVQDHAPRPEAPPAPPGTPGAAPGTRDPAPGTRDPAPGARNAPAGARDAPARARAAGPSAGLAAPASDASTPELIRLLERDPAASVRRTAAWSLARSRNDAARVTLERALRTDADPDVREMVAWALGQMGAAAAVTALAAAYESDADPAVRTTTVWALTELRGPSATAAITRALRDPDPRVRTRAAWGLGHTGSPASAEALVPLLTDQRVEVRTAAVWALGNLRATTAIPSLIDVLRADADSGVRRAALWAVHRMSRDAPADVFASALQDPDPVIREKAAAALGRGLVWPWPWPWPQPRPYPY